MPADLVDLDGSGQGWVNLCHLQQSIGPLFAVYMPP